MSDGFSEMVDQANAFFTKLAANNTKAFYEEHKAFYNDDIKKPAELLADLFAEDLARLTGKPHGPKVFRIHRDVRFSADKTPYKTNLHMNWTRPSQASTPVFFFGASPTYLMLGLGVLGLSKEGLTAYRSMVDTDGDALTDAMERAGLRLSTWGPEPLKRVPKPFDPDHPYGDLLKRKSFTVFADLPEGWQENGLLSSLNALAKSMMPLWEILDEAFPH